VSPNYVISEFTCEIQNQFQTDAPLNTGMVSPVRKEPTKHLRTAQVSDPNRNLLVCEMDPYATVAALTVRIIFLSIHTGNIAFVVAKHLVLGIY
jgi:hypothetical protein